MSFDLAPQIAQLVEAVLTDGSARSGGFLLLRINLP
jgi:hypothetical protein